MPTYDYRCKACGHALEAFQSISARPKRKCPSCGRAQLERQVGAGAAFLFKGAGFYLTDYRSKSYAEGAKGDAAAREAPGAKGAEKGAASPDAGAAKPAEPAPPKSEAPAAAETKPARKHKRRG
jgi:putative FmdB family regulatory protein